METHIPNGSSAAEEETLPHDAGRKEREKKKVREAISTGAAFDAPFVVMNPVMKT